MNREIKFRVWLKNRKKMRNVCAIDFSSNEVDLSGNDEYLGWYGCNEYELMQYTGLKDKNGVKIFEGDIVKHDDDDDIGFVHFDTLYCNYVVIFNENISYYLGDLGSKYLEVIGNVWENKELLENE